MPDGSHGQAQRMEDATLIPRLQQLAYRAALGLRVQKEAPLAGMVTGAVFRY